MIHEILVLYSSKVIHGCFWGFSLDATIGSTEYRQIKMMGMNIQQLTNEPSAVPISTPPFK
jgi:hypothetical protein